MLSDATHWDNFEGVTLWTRAAGIIPQPRAAQLADRDPSTLVDARIRGRHSAEDDKRWKWAYSQKSRSGTVALLWLAPAARPRLGSTRLRPARLA